MALLACAAGLTSTPRPADAGSTVSVTVDGAQQFQTVDGFGVNANAKNWNDGELVPALDLLIDQLGATMWRIDPFNKSDWEAVNDNNDPNIFDWTYYNALYENPSFQELWNTLNYLDQRGVQIVLGVSGVVPDWMGGSVINVNDEDEWVEMIASLVYYARNVRGIDFTLLSPMNEGNLGPPEGPLVGPAQYARLLNKLVARLGALGMGDIELLPPESAGVDTGYLPDLFADPTLMAHINHFSFHSYSGSNGGAHSTIKGSPYPDRDFWMTEWSESATDGFLDGGAQVADEWAFARTMTDYLFNHMAGNAAAAMAWDAFDNIHEHDTSGNYTHWGLLAYDLESGAYSPKPRFYTNAQFFKSVPPGSVRIAAMEAEPDLQVLAFRHAASGRLTIVGQNLGGSTLTLDTTITNVPSAPTTLALYRTSSSLSLARQPNVAVAAGTFSLQVPPDSFFTLTGTAGAAESLPPAISGVTAQAITAMGASVVWTTNEATDSRVEWGVTTSYGQSTVFDAALVTAHNQKLTHLTPGTTYHYRVHGADASGNASVSGDHTFTTAAALPTLTVTFDDLAGENQPLNGQYPSGVIDWGSGGWFHSGPFGLFSTKSVGFNGPSLTSASLTLPTPRRLVSIRAYNGGPPTTVTLSCPGQIDKKADLMPGEIVTVPTGWAGTCSSVTISSTNGWDTNFDDLVFVSGGAPQGPDSDGDGCSDAAEEQAAPGSEVFGGRRDPDYYWDFFDTPGQENGRDRVVSVSDIGRVVGRFGADDDGGAAAVNRSSDPLSAPPPSGYHPAFDRSGAIPGQFPWNASPPDGIISIGDIGSVVAQFGHSCA